MSILFRCPCGRSMVVESDRAGAVVTCPNCRRSLRVPSGKGRGLEIPAAPTAATTRTSRRCKRCGKDVPVDSQICPHCNTIMMDAVISTAEPTTKTKAATARPAAHRVAAPSGGIVYGGARGNWFSRLTSGGKAGVLIGAFVFLILMVIITYFVASSYQAGQISGARDRFKKALAEGRKLENRGEFQKAYNLYAAPSEIFDYIRGTGHKTDAELADSVETRMVALQYLVPLAKTRQTRQWRPKDQAEYDEAMAHLKATYPAYRQLCLGLSEAGLAAVAAGTTATPNQPAYEAKVTLAVEAYINLIRHTDLRQRAQLTFQTLTQGVRDLGDANRHWNDRERTICLNRARAYFEALKERVSKPGYPDAIRQ